MARRQSTNDVSATYNAFKQFEGKRYTGMKIGRSHKWYYDQGEWKERKLTPDEWEIQFAVNKRRAGKAPEGSGVPVGTQYHWYVLAHQYVTKLDANMYSTSLTGMKFKLAHRRAGGEKWSAGDRAQRNRLIRLLRSVADDLERQPVSRNDVDFEQIVPTSKAKKAKKQSRIHKSGTAA